MNLISVIVPCYNQANYLEECLQSVLNQTYKNWECIIVNDGSKDNTEDIAEKWVKKDNRFRYLYKENGGLSSARNAGTDMAKGSYIQFLDSDDMILPEKFEKSMKFADNAEIIYSDYYELKNGKEAPPYIDLKNNVFNFQNLLFGEIQIAMHCAIISKKIALNHKFNENFKLREDLIFWIEVLYENPAIEFVNEKLAVYRDNPAGGSKNPQMIDIVKSTILHIYDFLPNEEYKRKYFEKIITGSLNTNKKSGEAYSYIHQLHDSKFYKIHKKIYNLLGR